MVQGKPVAKDEIARVIRQFLSKKEQSDMELAIQLRKDGIITTPRPPYEGSQMTEIDNLINGDVFEFVLYDPAIHTDLFGTRMVNEIKGKGTSPYEKSRLVVQGYNNEGKKAILT
ncbi:hypothetical protein Vi05172_g5621 [Venturia inaequalis]|nr:hypothetical protein Vi05172_g5621 [Venturia inaequalis]